MTTVASRVRRGGEIRLRERLLDWFEGQARDLPWRLPREASLPLRDPYRVWVAEVMLQQTRVEAVVEPYGRFLRLFPSLAALAAADESDVLAAWSGLGYYRRARLLHAGARHLVARCDGRFPESRTALRAVPGIGDYTCGAILSFAFGRREAAVDANVTRVLARVAGIADPRTADARKAIAVLAARLVDCERPGDVNEALMDLGSAVCTQRIARCDACPIQDACSALDSGSPLAFGTARPRKAPREVRLACAVVRSGDGVLFVRRAADDVLLAGMWELPTVEVEAEAGAASREELENELARRIGTHVRLRGPVESVRHDIVGRRIVASVYVAELGPGSQVRLPEDARMVDAAGRTAIALPALPVKILRALAPEATPRSSAARGAA